MTARRYHVGDTIPPGLRVDFISTTAYQCIDTNGDVHWIPFYGPHGVDEMLDVVPLVRFGL